MKSTMDYVFRRKFDLKFHTSDNFELWKVDLESKTVTFFDGYVFFSPSVNAN